MLPREKVLDGRRVTSTGSIKDPRWHRGRSVKCVGFSQDTYTGEEILFTNSNTSTAVTHCVHYVNDWSYIQLRLSNVFFRKITLRCRIGETRKGPLQCANVWRKAAEEGDQFFGDTTQSLCIIMLNQTALLLQLQIL